MTNISDGSQFPNISRKLRTFWGFDIPLIIKPIPKILPLIKYRNFFKDKVYRTVIQRNVRLSEAPSHGLPCVVYDKNCVGSKSYFKLAEEFLKKNQIESAAWTLEKRKV